MALPPYSEIEHVIRQVILDDADVAAMIGTRLYPQPMPQNTSAPYGVYRRVSTISESSHSGPSGLARPRIEFFWVGGTKDHAQQGYDVAVELAQKVRKAIQDIRGSYYGLWLSRVMFEDEADHYDSNTKAVGRRQDWIVWGQES